MLEHAGATLDDQALGSIGGARQQLGLDQAAVGLEALEQLRGLERLEVVEAVLRQRAVDVAAGIEDPTLRVAEGAGL
ncbi:MAG TPA: hypothetical protein VFQ14_02405 [Thermoleophilaceae bacterium]|nr:hypothetical protein [Thermoleophilaceae bacterium]